MHSHIQPVDHDEIVSPRNRRFRSGHNVVPSEVLSFTAKAFNAREPVKLPRQLLRLWREHWLREQQYQFQRRLSLRRKDWTARDRRHRRRLLSAKPAIPRPTHYKRLMDSDGLDNQYRR